MDSFVLVSLHLPSPIHQRAALGCRPIARPLYGVRIEDKMRGSGVAKAHGCMMVLAWVFCSSVGVILSRYYKDMWPNSGLLGERVWFQLHRILMGVCVGLTCIAVILAFAFCYGYSTLSSYPDYIHPILGLIVLWLAVINVNCRRLSREDSLLLDGGVSVGHGSVLVVDQKNEHFAPSL
nr:unnamed protein product [Spirometra erinaceieuropaei]